MKSKDAKSVSKDGTNPGSKDVVENRAPKKPKGHRQRGAGTIITGKEPVVTDDGIVLQAHQRLPSQLLLEYCQREKRPNPQYQKSSSNDSDRYRLRVILPDKKNSKDDLAFCPVQDFDSEKTAKDFAALLALVHFQPSIPLERKLPEPFRTTWIGMIENLKKSQKAIAPETPGGSKKSIVKIVPKENVTMESTMKMKSDEMKLQPLQVSLVESSSTNQQPMKQPPLPVLDLKSEYLFSSERQKITAITEKELIKKRTRNEKEEYTKANPPMLVSLSASKILTLEAYLKQEGVLECSLDEIDDEISEQSQLNEQGQSQSQRTSLSANNVTMPSEGLVSSGSSCRREYSSEMLLSVPSAALIEEVECMSAMYGDTCEHTIRGKVASISYVYLQ